MAKISPSAYVAPTAILMGDVTLEAEASVWYQSVLRGDNAPIVVGEQSNLQDGTIVHTDEDLPCVIGRRVGVGHRVLLHGCHIEDECLIGNGAIVLNRVRVGAGSVIGAGALLPEGMTVPPGSVVMGIPGRVVRSVDAKLAQRIEETWRDYLVLARRHREGAFPVVGAGEPR